MRPAKPKWRSLDIGGDAPDELFAELGRANKVCTESRPVEASEQSEDVLLRAAAGNCVGKVQDGHHGHVRAPLAARGTGSGGRLS